jgi:hypothetical protein
MSSAAENRTGTASGINNAVARVAGVLAIAILGVVMLAAFRYRLHTSLGRLNLDPNVLSQIESSAVKLGALEVPSELDASAATRVRAEVAQAFIFGFRRIMFVCVGLAAASAAVAWRMIPSIKGLQKSEQ